MSGSQGDILKVDLVKGGKTVRIRMLDTYAGNRGNTVHVETSVYACGFEGGKAATLWNGDGDVIDTRSFYSITDYSPFGKLIYTEDEAEADRIEAIRNARRAAGYRKPRSRSRRVMTKIPSETVAEILKTRPGYKRIKSEDIGPVYRIDGHYYTELDRLPSKKAERRQNRLTCRKPTKRASHRTCGVRFFLQHLRHHVSRSARLAYLPRNCDNTDIMGGMGFPTTAAVYRTVSTIRFEGKETGYGEHGQRNAGNGDDGEYPVRERHSRYAAGEEERR